MANSNSLRTLSREIGWGATLLASICPAVNRLFYFECLHAVSLSTTAVSYERAQLPAGFEGRFLHQHDLLALAAADPALELEPEFIKARFASGDRCFALFENGALAAYGWFASRPAPITSEFSVVFDGRRDVFYHHGWCRTRGRRLRTLLITHATKVLLKEGIESIVAIVPARSAAELKSTTKIGARVLGQIYIAAFAKHFVVVSGAECRRRGFGLWPRRRLHAHILGRRGLTALAI